MNIILAVRPQHTENILAGLKTIELRGYVPPSISMGSTIFLCHSRKIWGHCTFAGASPMPEAGLFRDQWLESIAHLACVTAEDALRYLSRGRDPHAWHVRYPVRYSSPRPQPGPIVRSYVYTATSPPPHETHPGLANYLLYLKNR